MNIDEIKQLIDLLRESEISELEVERAEARVRIRAFDRTPAVAAGPALMAPMMMPPMAAPAASAPPAAAPAPASDNSVMVASPIVGTFYESASPGAEPFVKVGDRVAKGQVLCIIESMKLMNEIESEHTGTIVARLAENGKPVEYGQPLFKIQPN
jgi:acetyl-CoA carboxylase biotin carboxyl carrier protein